MTDGDRPSLDSIDMGPDTLTGIRRSEVGEARLDRLLDELEEELALLGEEIASDRPPPPPTH